MREKHLHIDQSKERYLSKTMSCELTFCFSAKILESVTKENEGELPPVPIELLVISKKKEENEEQMKKMFSAIQGVRIILLFF